MPDELTIPQIVGHVSLIGADAVHSIENPLCTSNAALHVFHGAVHRVG